MRALSSRLKTERSVSLKAEAKLLVNRIKTPDGTILTSRHRHDYVEHLDKNGKYYAVDGGTEYPRRVGNHDFEDVSLYSDDLHEKLREAFAWGTYGKNGDDPFYHVPLRDMTSGHIEAILERHGDGTQKIKPEIEQLFLNELLHRK